MVLQCSITKDGMADVAACQTYGCASRYKHVSGRVCQSLDRVIIVVLL